MDACDIAAQTSQDCNTNGVPHECDADCNGNSIPDECDIAVQTSQDCNTNGVPDECEGNACCLQAVCVCIDTVESCCVAQGGLFRPNDECDDPGFFCPCSGETIILPPGWGE